MTDLGTGGGEWLASLGDRAHNVDQPLGLDTPALPFADESFSLIVSRHESYVAKEVARLLHPGGVFVTRQLDGNTNGYRTALGLPAVEQPVFDVALAREQLEAAGACVLAAEADRAATTFSDAGAIAYCLRAIPRLIDGFGIYAFRSERTALEQRLETEGR